MAPGLLVLTLMAALAPTPAHAGAGAAVETLFTNPDALAADGTPIYRWTSLPAVAVTVHDAQGSPLAADIRLFVEADEWNNAQLGKAVDIHTDDGFALIVLPLDLNKVGFLPGAHTAWLIVDTDVGRVVATAMFDVKFP